ncbi:hypothetical protein ACIHQR_32040 [Corallococcus coralloides]|uniref:hypothetical protein n=1 Tax=Corallococcus coralloides TaxID=184914 RepID=UPI00385133AF
MVGGIGGKNRAAAGNQVNSATPTEQPTASDPAKTQGAQKPKAATPPVPLSIETSSYGGPTSSASSSLISVPQSPEKRAAEHRDLPKGGVFKTVNKGPSAPSPHMGTLTKMASALGINAESDDAKVYLRQMCDALDAKHITDDDARLILPELKVNYRNSKALGANLALNLATFRTPVTIETKTFQAGDVIGYKGHYGDPKAAAFFARPTTADAKEAEAASPEWAAHYIATEKNQAAGYAQEMPGGKVTEVVAKETIECKVIHVNDLLFSLGELKGSEKAERIQVGLEAQGIHGVDPKKLMDSLGESGSANGVMYLVKGLEGGDSEHFHELIIPWSDASSRLATGKSEKP